MAQWRPSCPEPFWVGWRLRKAKCECGEVFKARRGRTAGERYKLHWVDQHEADHADDPDWPRSLVR